MLKAASINTPYHISQILKKKVPQINIEPQKTTHSLWCRNTNGSIAVPDLGLHYSAVVMEKPGTAVKGDR